jgi:nanoRNase/pAp phosphatase (c-di-AMP/oligoRNAs hydrolase)
MRHVLILTHDHPDPDALASAWALGVLLRRHAGKRVQLAYSGIVGRAENRAMIRHLRIPILPLERKLLERAQAIALVDAQPATGNTFLPEGRLPHVVLDHHPMRPGTRRVAYAHVDPAVGATATLAAGYLEAAGIRPQRRLATALFYAIRTETQNLRREASPADARQFARLFPLVDNVALSQIELAPIPRAYFALMDQAIRNTRVYDRRVTVTRLGRVGSPDMVAQFADLLVRLEGVTWSVVMGRYRGAVLLSIRTDRVGAHAGGIVARIVAGEGSAGGHGMMAAGRVPVPGSDSRAYERVERRLVRRAISVLRVGGRGRPLLARRTAP